MDARHFTSIDWVIDLPSGDLNATEKWVFRFGKINAGTTLKGKHIPSPLFTVRERPAPPPESSASSTSSSSSTTAAADDGSGTAEAASEPVRAGSTGELATGAKAGVGVGAAVGAFALISVS